MWGGALISTLNFFFPETEIRGCDIIDKPETLPADKYEQIDLSRPFSVFPPKKFNYIFSVSGVMEFDNTLQFFRQVREHLKPGGTFIVTNDNIIAVRDRLTYLFFGKVGTPYKLFVTQDQPTWKPIPIHNLLRTLQDAGFRIRAIKYVEPGWKDWLTLPLALLIYPIQSLYIHLRRRNRRSTMPLELKRAMYPFMSLLSRHYLMICEPV